MNDEAVKRAVWLTGDDARLMTDCRFEAFRGPGPGGQKRNKTSSSVRLTHVPTGLSTIAGESRSQHENRAKALRRLRQLIALQVRCQVDGSKCLSIPILTCRPRSAEFLPAVAAVLDVLVACDGSVSAAASALQTTTAHLVRFLQSTPNLLTQSNRIRQQHGLKPLGA